MLTTPANNNLLTVTSAIVADNQTRYTATIATEFTTVHIHWRVDVLSFSDFLMELKRFLVGWIEVLAFEHAHVNLT